MGVQANTSEMVDRVRSGGNRFLLGVCFVGLGIVGLGLIPAMIQKKASYLDPKYVSEVERGPKGNHRIAVTFDAGGDSSGVEAVLATLDRYGVECTFFLTGNWVDRNRSVARRIREKEHEIGNHTWSHPDLTRLNPVQIRNEVERAEALLREVTGFGARPLVRAPYGARNATVIRTLNELGYVSIYWSLDSLDSVAPPKSREFLIERVTSPNDTDLDGAIVLMHLGEAATAEALGEIIMNLHGRGFQLVTVSELYVR